MALVFAIRGTFSSQPAATLQSIYYTNSSEKFEVYILTNNVPNEDLEKIKAMQWSKNLILRFIPIDISEIEDLPIAYHLDLASYFRLLIHKIVPGEKAIYLDSDLVVTGSLRPLWDIELGDNYFAAVPDFCGDVHTEIPYDLSLGYSNTGVMLMNLMQWRL